MNPGGPCVPARCRVSRSSPLALVDSAIRPEEFPDRPVWAYFDGLSVAWDDDGVQAVTVDGDPVEADDRYTVAASAYVAGSDAFDGTGNAVRREGPPHSDALVSHARDCGLTGK